MRKIFFILLLTLFVWSCKSVQEVFRSDDDKEEPVVVDNTKYEEDFSYGKVIDHNSQSLYEVTNADSLESIAGKYGVSSATIIEMNNLQDPYTLKPGTIIKVPTIRTITRSNKTNLEQDTANNQRVIIIKPSNKTK